LRVLVIGAGDFGKPIISYLSKRDHLVTVIDKDEKQCKDVAEHADATIFQGSACDPEIWKHLEADKIDALLALSNDDGINQEACEIAKKQFGIPFVIARADQTENISKIKQSGADIVVCPSQETLSLFINALESLTLETLYQDVINDFKIVKVTIPQNASIVGKSAITLDISDDCKIISIFRSGAIILPEKSFIFKKGDKVLLSGSSKLVEKNAEKLRTIEIT